jgi:hypothetical protein
VCLRLTRRQRGPDVAFTQPEPSIKDDGVEVKNKPNLKEKLGNRAPLAAGRGDHRGEFPTMRGTGAAEHCLSNDRNKAGLQGLHLFEARSSRPDAKHVCADARLSITSAFTEALPALFLDKGSELCIPFGEHHACVPLLAWRKSLCLFPPFFCAFPIVCCVPGARHVIPCFGAQM